MTLVDERELLNEQEKRKKTYKLIIKIIIILIIIGILLIIYRNISINSVFKCYVNDKKVPDASENLLYKDDKGKVFIENGKVFISIRELSNTLGYQFYNSEYKIKGEDKTRCQVKVDNIYTSYVAYSNKIYKAIPQTISDNKNSTQNKIIDSEGFEQIGEEIKTEFEYFTAQDKIKYVNDDLYASIEAIQIGFDVSVTYNKKNNTLKVYTLNELEKAAKKTRKNAADSSEYSYKNKRLLKYGMAIVKDSDGNFGVASYTNKNKEGTYVASCKYSEIDFNEGTKTLTTVISSDKKQGILYINTNTQLVEKNIEPQYEEIKEMTNNFDYFLIKQEGKYGVINESGAIILPAIFDEIGIKEEKYSNIDCKYVLQGKYIPVKQNGKWGLYNTDGAKLIEPQFEDVGCSLAQNGDSAVIIPNINNNITGIVFLYNKEKSFYGVYNADTGEKIAISLTEVFRKIENGEENYYINYIIDRATSKVHTINLKENL